MEKLGQKLPRYEDILDTVPSKITERFRASLRNVYVDLFEFFAAVARVFSQRNGGILTHTLILAGALRFRLFVIYLTLPY